MDLIFELGRPGGWDRDEQGTRGRLLEILRTEGPLAVAERLAAEVHGIYRPQGVCVDDRHYEVVLREMIGRLQVTDPGDTGLEAGQIVSTDLLAAANAATAGRAATAEPTIVGVTEAAVSTCDFIAAAASHGGLPALARAAARKQTVPLCTIRHAAAFGMGPRRTYRHS
jgi:DNA-directed RNA polymerase subunit beta'